MLLPPVETADFIIECDLQGAQSSMSGQNTSEAPSFIHSMSEKANGLDSTHAKISWLEATYVTHAVEQRLSFGWVLRSTSMAAVASANGLLQLLNSSTPRMEGMMPVAEQPPIHFFYTHFHDSIRLELDELAVRMRYLETAGEQHLHALLIELTDSYRFLEQVYKYHSSVEDEVRLLVHQQIFAVRVLSPRP